MVQPAANSSPMLAYLNLEHGLRMDYPASWEVKERGSPVSYLVAFGAPRESATDQYEENLSILVQALFVDTTLEAFLGGCQMTMKQAQVQVQESAMTVLAGQQALRVVCGGQVLGAAGPLPGKMMIFLFLIGAKGYTVTYTGEQGHFETFLPVVQQMLATLQAH